jgi:hypothetical protein
MLTMITHLRTGTLAGVTFILIALLLVSAREARAVDWADARAHDKGCSGTARIFHVRCERPDGGWSHDCPDMPKRSFRGATMTKDPKRLPDRAWAEVAIMDARCGPHWGDFKKDHCTAIGKRQYSSILWGIPAGKSWERTCDVTPATVNGQEFPKPSRCVNTNVNMWGEFDVNDESCPHWGEWKREACETIPGDKGLKARRYSALLLEPPKGATWQAACVAEPVVIGTYKLPGPHMCSGAGNIELTKAVLSGVVKGGLALGGGFVGNVSTVDKAEGVVTAASEISSEVKVYLDNQQVQSAASNEDMRNKWYQMWGVVWLPDSECGLPPASSTR